MEFIIQLLDADIHVLMRNDLHDFACDRPNDGIEIELSGE
jgi:hypothetical protein